MSVPIGKNRNDSELIRYLEQEESRKKIVFRLKNSSIHQNLKIFGSWSDLKNFMRQAGEVTYTDAHIRSGENRGEVCFKNRKGLYTAKVCCKGSRR